ncbi:MAG TPA: hypothetical protein VGE48_02050 [Candidatus Paceibacterota bacterium]
MRELLAGVVILFVVGVGAFLYRNTMERPGVIMPEVACTMEAKICPDGTSVGRMGPTCAFAPCAFPNVEIESANIGFVAPEGYKVAASEDALVRLEKPSAGGWPPHVITVYRYPIAEGETADEILLRVTTYQPSGEQATDFERFSTVSAGGKTYRETTIERFEALIHTSYFLVREGDVLRFDIVEHDVADWMSTTASHTFPEHQALLGLLRSVK